MVRRGRVLGACGVAALVVCASAAAPAGQIGGRPTRPHVIPPKGPARQVIFKYCTSCHGIDGSFKGNRHLVFPDNTQRTSNMLVSLLHLYGIEEWPAPDGKRMTDKLGTSTGRLAPLEMV